MPENSNTPATATKGLSFDVTVKNPESGEVNVVPIYTFIPVVGQGKNNPKLFPTQIETWELSDVRRIWGDKKVMAVLRSKLKQIYTNFTGDATTRDVEQQKTDKDGVPIVDPKTGAPVMETVSLPEEDTNVIQTSFSEMFSELSLRGESKTALTRRFNELQSQLQAIADTIMSEGISAEDFAKAKENYKTFREELTAIQESIAKKKSAGSSEE